MGKGCAGLCELGVGGGEALRQLGLAILVGGKAGLGAFQVDCAGRCTGGGVADLAVELVAAGGAGAIFSVQPLKF